MVQLYNAGVLDGLAQLPDESVQCCVTSPPYDDLRLYNGYTWDFAATAKELYRVLVPGGVLCWNVNDSVVDGSETLTSCKQKIFFREQCGFRIHDTMIYEKCGSSKPEKTRYQQVFEYVFILSKGRPRVFNPIVDKANKRAGLPGSYGIRTIRERDGTMTPKNRETVKPFSMRGNVWRGKTAGQETVCTKIEHPAVMPLWLAKDLIRSWSNEGDMILDPLAGSCTTLAAAKSLGRRGIGIELSAEYCQIAVDTRLHGQHTLEG